VSGGLHTFLRCGIQSSRERTWPEQDGLNDDLQMRKGCGRSPAPGCLKVPSHQMLIETGLFGLKRASD
jgi:hypothetical protein